MSGGYGANQYKKTSVMTASRTQLLVMLYEAAIKNVKSAISAIEKNNRAEKSKAIGKTHDILMELLNSLNFEVGGAIAKDLERLYNYMIDQLIKGNFENSKSNFENILKLLETLLDGWKGAIENLNDGSEKKANGSAGTPTK